MKTRSILLALALGLVAILPTASAAGKLLCSENPGDDVQFCVAAGTTTSGIRHTYVSGATSFCIVFGICAPVPTTGTTTTTVPDVTLCGTYYHEGITGKGWTASCYGVLYGASVSLVTSIDLGYLG